MPDKCLHIIPVKKAIEIGMARFFTGQPCIRGHVSERSSKNRTCFECRNESRVEKSKDRALFNAISNFSTGVYSAFDAKLLGLTDYYTGIPCPRDHVTSRRASDGKCRECVRIKNRARNKRDKEYVAVHIKAWKEKNKLKLRSYDSRRRARVCNSAENHTDKDIERILKQQNGKCANCRIPTKNEYHVDHVMPLSLGGDNSSKNIQILCPDCNLRKAAKSPERWAQENGRLL